MSENEGSVSEFDQADIKKFFASSSISRSVSEILEKGGYVESGTSAQKIAISYAIALNNFDELPTKLTDRNGFNLGVTQFDTNGSIKTLIKEVCFPDKVVSHREIYDFAELLCEFGMMEIKKELQTGKTLVQIITEIN